MMASVSAIQIWTLVVAGLAVVASVAGIFVNARIARKSEHDVWQRDLRVRLYSECTGKAEEYITLLTSYASNVHRTYRDQASMGLELEHLAKVRHLRIDIVNKVNEVQTFGSNDVSASAVALGRVILDASTNIVAVFPIPSLDTMRDELAKPGKSLTEFRSTVRKSLEISRD